MFSLRQRIIHRRKNQKMDIQELVRFYAGYRIK